MSIDALKDALEEGASMQLRLRLVQEMERHLKASHGNCDVCAVFLRTLFTPHGVVTRTDEVPPYNPDPDLIAYLEKP